MSATEMRKKILIVDDEVALREVLRYTLDLLGYEVFIAGNGAAGLSMFTKNPGIEVVISDVNMPYMDGIDMICNITKINSQVHCIVMTGYPSQKKLIECRERKILASVLEKPFTVPAIQRAVEEALYSDM